MTFQRVLEGSWTIRVWFTLLVQGTLLAGVDSVARLLTEIA